MVITSTGTDILIIVLWLQCCDHSHGCTPWKWIDLINDRNTSSDVTRSLFSASPCLWSPAPSRTAPTRQKTSTQSSQWRYSTHMRSFTSQHPPRTPQLLKLRGWNDQRSHPQGAVTNGTTSWSDGETMWKQPKSPAKTEQSNCWNIATINYVKMSHAPLAWAVRSPTALRRRYWRWCAGWLKKERGKHHGRPGRSA